MSNNEEIMVSVFCIAYNHEKYIKSALEGFVSQITNFKYEVIVHDDASTDGTAEIIREYEKKYPDIIKPIYQKENQYSKGISIMNKIILPKAKGTYVAICEGDDYWTNPHKLQLQFDILEAHPECSLCVHRVQCHNEDDSNNSRSIPEKKYRLQYNKLLSKKNLLDLYYKKGGYPFHTSSYFFRKKVLLEKVDLKRDIGILRKCLINGDAFYLDNAMSVRRLLTVGNFNNRLKTSGDRAKIDFCISNIQNEYNFDIYTQKKYHRYTAYSIFQNILRIGTYNTDLAKELFENYNFSVFSPMRFPLQKIKCVIFYLSIKYFPAFYKRYKTWKG